MFDFRRSRTRDSVTSNIDCIVGYIHLSYDDIEEAWCHFILPSQSFEFTQQISYARNWKWLHIHPSSPYIHRLKLFFYPVQVASRLLIEAWLAPLIGPYWMVTLACNSFGTRWNDFKVTFYYRNHHVAADIFHGFCEICLSKFHIHCKTPLYWNLKTGRRWLWGAHDTYAPGIHSFTTVYLCSRCYRAFTEDMIWLHIPGA